MLKDSLKRARKRKEFTQEQLAAAAKVSKATIVDMENGSANPTLGTIRSVADALGVKVETLVKS